MKTINQKALCLAWAIEVTNVKRPSLNKQAMALAHSIKAAYSSFRVALLVAYKVLKDAKARQQVLNGLSLAQLKLSALGNQKWVCCFNAWVEIWNLDYLD